MARKLTNTELAHRDRNRLLADLRRTEKELRDTAASLWRAGQIAASGGCTVAAAKVTEAINELTRGM